MNGPLGWPPLRRRPPRLAKHRALPTVTETDMPPASPAASLPQYDYRTSTPYPAGPVAPEPEPIVTCGNCGAIGPSSLIPEVPTRGPRCADTDACTKRWYAGRPVSLLPHGAEPLEPLPEPGPVLPPGQEAALENFQTAHDEQDAAEAGEPLAEDEQPTEDAAEAPADPAEPAPVAAEPEPQPEGEAAE